MTFSAHIDTIDHLSQRYDTVGDWTASEAGEIDIRVSSLHDWRHEALIAIHELVEALLCRNRGISSDEVDNFDITYTEGGEPGADPRAPYHREHMFAFSVERQLASELGVDWDEYERAVTELRR